jgi:hypothetical protein
MRWWLRFALLTTLMAATRAASAAPTDADRETARTLMDQGAQKYQAQDFAGALDRFRGADAIMHVPTTGVAVARALAALGKLVEARNAALDASRLPPQANEGPVFAQAREAAAKLADELGERIPTIRLVVSGAAPGTEIQANVDGESIQAAALELPRKVNPGKHRVVVAASGRATETRDVELKERQEQAVVIVLKAPSEAAPTAPPTASPPAPAPTAPAAATQAPPVVSEQAPPKKSHTLTYVGFGAGAVGIVLGTVTGILSLSKASSAKDHCVDNRCTADAQGDIDSSKTLAKVSDVAFVVGVIGVGTGIYALLSGSGKGSASTAAETRRAVRARTEGSCLSVAGRF